MALDLLDYGSRIEAVLRTQAEVAGLIQHAGDRGGAREVFVRSFLGLFLPPSVVVGSGEIVDGVNDRNSRQQDVLLYRGNFPIVSTLAGTALYLAEGVLGTIEVKSKLTREELSKVWDNVESVRAMQPSMLGVSLAPVRFLGGRPKFTESMSAAEVIARSEAGMNPGHEDPLLNPPSERIRTYLFAFDGATKETLLDEMRSLGQARGWNGCPDCICVLGRAFAIHHRDDTLADPAGSEPSVENPASPVGWFLAHMWRGLFGRIERLPPLRPYLRTTT